MNEGWQVYYYEPRPSWWQRLLCRFVCGWLGHRWPVRTSAAGVPCLRCGMSSVQLN